MARVKVQVPIDESAQAEPPVVSEQPAPAEEPAAPAPTQTGPTAYRRWTKNQLMVGALILVVLILAIVVLNDRHHLKQEVNKLSTSQPATSQTDVQKYQDEIGKIVELPGGQTPSLIPVKDAKSLAAENTFFKNAKDGDVVLLYVLPDKSVQAVLYRPVTRKVVEVTSSATIGGNQTTATPPASLGR